MGMASRLTDINLQARVLFVSTFYLNFNYKEVN